MLKQIFTGRRRVRLTIHIYCKLYVYINNFLDIYGSQLPLQHIDLNLNFVRRNSAPVGYLATLYKPIVLIRKYFRNFFYIQIFGKVKLPSCPYFFAREKKYFAKMLSKFAPLYRETPSIFHLPPHGDTIINCQI